MSHSDEADSRLAAAVADSRVVTALERAGDRIAELGRSEITERLAARGRCVVTDSYVYRWLTADPDPEVIVIDLRETHTVGPVVAILDRVLAWLAEATTSSNAVALVRSMGAEFRAAPVRLVAATVAVVCATALFVVTAFGGLGVLPTVVLVVLAFAGLAGTQVTASWGDLVDSRVGQLVAAALEPPADATAGNRSPEHPEGSDE